MKGILLSAAGTLLAVNVAHAATYHVAPSGDDVAAGTATAPWRTIQRAADAVAPGDTVTIHAGTYAGFVVATRGTAAQPIAFVADGVVRIDGAATADRDAVHIENAAWIRIEGLAVTGAARAGISAMECDHITIRGNVTDANGRWGIFSSFCDDLVIEHNQASRSGSEHGIYVSNSGDRPVIRGNEIFGNAMCGVHMNGDIFMGGDGVISDAIVEDNVIYDNGRLGGSAINGDGVTGARIRNNVLDGNHASGVSLYRIDGGAPSTGNEVVNNTVRMASDARWAVNIQDGSTGNVLRNNILLHASSTRGAIDVCGTCVTGLVSDRNAVVGRFAVDGAVVDLAGWRSRTGVDSASFVATATELFVDPAAGDLALRAGSPAIDRGGAAGAPAVDVTGRPRPQGAGIDIGAYEYCDGGCADAPPDDGGGAGDGPPTDDGTVTEPIADVDSGGCGAGRNPNLATLLLLALVGLGEVTRSRRSRRARRSLR